MADDSTDSFSRGARQPVVVEESVLDGLLRDGMTIALGGLATACHAMVAVRHIIRLGLRDLTIIGSPVGGTRC